MVPSIKQIPVRSQRCFLINIMEGERQLDNLYCITKLQEQQYEAEQRGGGDRIRECTDGERERE